MHQRLNRTRKAVEYPGQPGTHLVFMKCCGKPPSTGTCRLLDGHADKRIGRRRVETWCVEKLQLLAWLMCGIHGASWRGHHSLWRSAGMAARVHDMHIDQAIAKCHAPLSR
jgi:hypothetical protein